MVTRILTLTFLILTIFSCKEDELLLPETTANGTVTIEGIEYQVNYGMIKDAGPDGNGLRAYRLVFSDKPIGWHEDGQFYSTSSFGFRMVINFLTFENVLEQGRYEFWLPDNFPENRWWVLDHLSFRNEDQANSNHPNQGAVVISELNGNYSFIFNLAGNSENEQATIKGTVFGELPLIIEN